jgi:putative proteasome-type protease
MGEVKYGKPIIDRIIRPATPLRAAATCVLISMDSTLRSNLSVGLPLDLAICRKGALEPDVLQHIEENNIYFNSLRQAWMDGLRDVFKELPDPDWLNGNRSGVPSSTAPRHCASQSLKLSSARRGYRSGPPARGRCWADW